MTVSVAVFETPPAVAVNVATVFAVTAVVYIGKDADALPAETNTLGGTVTEPLLLERITVVSTIGAPVSVTVPDSGLPPVVLDLLSKNAERAGGLTVRSLVFVTEGRSGNA